MKTTKQQEIDSIAEKWINIVLAHVRAKRLKKSAKKNLNKWLIRTNKEL